MSIMMKSMAGVRAVLETPKKEAEAAGCTSSAPDHGLAGDAVPGRQVEDRAKSHCVQPPAERRASQVALLKVSAHASLQLLAQIHQHNVVSETPRREKAPDEGKSVDGAVLIDGDSVDEGGEGEAVA